MVSKEWYQVPSDCHGSIAGVERRVEDGWNYCVQCFLEYGFCDLYIEGDGKKIYFTFNYFSLFDLRLSSDCEFLISKFK